MLVRLTMNEVARSLCILRSGLLLKKCMPRINVRLESYISRPIFELLDAVLLIRVLLELELNMKPLVSLDAITLEN